MPKEFDNSKFCRLRSLLNLNQSEFAKKVNSSQQIIAMIEKNKRGVPSSIREGFFKRFKVGYEEAAECTTQEELQTLLNKQPISNTRLPDNIVSIPLHNIAAAAGAGTLLDAEPETDTMYFDKRFLKQIIKTDNYSTLHLIYAKGNSMDSGWNQPNDIKDGDLLMVDTSQTTGNDQIFVILFNNELRVKRLFKRGDALFISSNNSKYKDEVYYPNDKEIEVKVIGKVVWNGSKEIL